MKLKNGVKLFIVVMSVLFIAQIPVLAQQVQEPTKEQQETVKKEVEKIMKPDSKEAQQKETQKKDTQPKEAQAKDNPATAPEENPIARFKAIDISENLVKENLENIYALKVIVANFSEEGWQKDFDEIYKQYKEGVRKFYKRDVIHSRVELEKNKHAIAELYSKIAEVYKGQLDGMLDKAADKILDFSLDERNQFDPDRTRILFRNMMRLTIAYNQLDDAERAREDKLNKTAVSHLRVSKLYTIAILEELDPDNSKGKYDIHKADNLSRVAAGK